MIPTTTIYQFPTESLKLTTLTPHGSPERHLQEIEEFIALYSPIIQKGAWCLDIGTNSGCSSFIMSHFSETGKIIGFEPDVIAYKFMQELVKENGLTDRFDCYNLAAYNEYTEKEFIFSEWHDNGGIVDGYTFKERGANLRTSSVGVQCVDTLDFLVKKYGFDTLKANLKFIKIDTEGDDYLILNNLKDLILAAKPIIIIEWWRYEHKNKPIFDAIANIGYNPLRSDNRQPAKLEQFPNVSHDLILMP